jgi:hypothetical protein
MAAVSADVSRITEQEAAAKALSALTARAVRTALLFYEANRKKCGVDMWLTGLQVASFRHGDRSNNVARLVPLTHGARVRDPVPVVEDAVEADAVEATEGNSFHVCDGHHVQLSTCGDAATCTCGEADEAHACVHIMAVIVHTFVCALLVNGMGKVTRTPWSDEVVTEKGVLLEHDKGRVGVSGAILAARVLKGIEASNKTGRPVEVNVLACHHDLTETYETRGHRLLGVGQFDQLFVRFSGAERGTDEYAWALQNMLNFLDTKQARVDKSYADTYKVNADECTGMCTSSTDKDAYYNVSFTRCTCPHWRKMNTNARRRHHYRCKHIFALLARVFDARVDRAIAGWVAATRTVYKTTEEVAAEAAVAKVRADRAAVERVAAKKAAEVAEAAKKKAAAEEAAARQAAMAVAALPAVQSVVLGKRSRLDGVDEEPPPKRKKPGVPRKRRLPWVK